MPKPPVNYTSKVPVSRTLSEVQTLLGEGGASAVAVTYENRKPSGLTFQLQTAHGPRTFTLPVNVDGLAALMRKADYPAGTRTTDLSRFMTREQAERVAWRIVKDWLQAQLAIIDAQMVRFEQVMLPYLQIEGGTLWDRYLDNEQRAIGARRDG